MSTTKTICHACGRGTLHPRRLADFQSLRDNPLGLNKPQSFCTRCMKRILTDERERRCDEVMSLQRDIDTLDAALGGLIQ